MEPLDYLEALKRRWSLVAAALLVTGAAFWLTTPDGVETSSVTDYSATHTLLVNHESSTRSGVQTNLRVLAVLATSGDIPRRVTERLGLSESPQALMERVQVDADPKIDVLRISSTGADPEQIVVLVDTFADEVLRVAAERTESQRNEAVARAKAITEGQQTRIRDLEERISDLPLESAEARIATAERDAVLEVYARQQGVLQNLTSQPPGPGLLSLGPAVPVPTAVADPSSAWMLSLTADPRARLLIGALLGVLLGSGLAILIDRLDSRVRSRRQAERAFGLPVVAEISRVRPARARHSPLAAGSTPANSELELAEAYRQLAFAVLHTPRWVLAPRPPGDEEDPGIKAARLVQGPSRLVVVTSAAREGALCAIVANLATSLAAIGRDVIAVDADHERPRLAEYLGARPDDGDPSQPSAEDAPRLLATTVPGVRVAPQASLLCGDLAAGRRIIHRYLDLADIVLTSCPPILSGGEAAVWTVEADAVLIAASSGSTTADAASVTREHLARLQAQVLGVAFVAAEGHRRRVAPIRRRSRPTLPAPPRHAPASPPPTQDGEPPATPRPHPEGDLRRREVPAVGPEGNGRVTDA
ncbi:MAG: hypothetical protein M3252_06525, partial [Actinomycetota bacterium]|nr:hypothetical protein [Actinomycetota bacterium]